MTCTKTGAHIFIEQYDEYAYCDAFEIETGDGTPFHAPICYFRIVEVSRLALRSQLHYTVVNVVDWFDRDALHYAQTLISDNCINHGYEGKPL